MERDSVILLFFALASCYGLAHSILMVASPQKHKKLLIWLRTRIGRSRLEYGTGLQQQPGLHLEYRLAGLALLAICGWLLTEAVRKFMTTK